MTGNAPTPSTASLSQRLSTQMQASQAETTALLTSAQTSLNAAIKTIFSDAQLIITAEADSLTKAARQNLNATRQNLRLAEWITRFTPFVLLIPMFLAGFLLSYWSHSLAAQMAISQMQALGLTPQTINGETIIMIDPARVKIIPCAKRIQCLKIKPAKE